MQSGLGSLISPHQSRVSDDQFSLTKLTASNDSKKSLVQTLAGTTLRVCHLFRATSLSGSPITSLSRKQKVWPLAAANRRRPPNGCEKSLSPTLSRIMFRLCPLLGTKHLSDAPRPPAGCEVGRTLPEPSLLSTNPRLPTSPLDPPKWSTKLFWAQAGQSNLLSDQAMSASCGGPPCKSDCQALPLAP